MIGSRILILVPHPDDEVVAAAATIQRALAAGAKIYALYLTHGCIAQETMWPWARDTYDKVVKRRLGESDRAAAHLGITPLGWPRRPARHLWRDMNKVYDEIRDAIRTYDIDQLWVPAYEGGNADHDALNACAYRVAITYEMSVLEFAEYNFLGGACQSQRFPFQTGDEQTLELTIQERVFKQRALEIYQSEQKNLNYVETSRECFRPLAAYDYSKPAHEGTLWYARFHWVPFKHPRVDFTKPEEVSAAIIHFLAGSEPFAPEASAPPESAMR